MEIVVHLRRPLPLQSADWMLDQRRSIERALNVMTTMLGERDYCHGNSLSLADIATGCALGCLDFRITDLDWRSHHPSLVALAARLAQRPSFAATVPRLVEGVSIDYVAPATR